MHSSLGEPLSSDTPTTPIVVRDHVSDADKPDPEGYKSPMGAISDVERFTRARALPQESLDVEQLKSEGAELVLLEGFGHLLLLTREQIEALPDGQGLLIYPEGLEASPSQDDIALPTPKPSPTLLIKGKTLNVDKYQPIPGKKCLPLGYLCPIVGVVPPPKDSGPGEWADRNLGI